MNVLDLFSGIGGFSLGLERAGMKTVAFCEINPYCRRVLAKHWPEVPIYEDVRTLNAKRLKADGIRVDAMCGGFPCQDISYAGPGTGLAGERSGLWFQYARLVGEIRPAVVIIENVSALRSRGLDEVLRTLAAFGYDAEWHCIPASAVGAPHRRDRVWIVAHPNSEGKRQSPLSREAVGIWSSDCREALADADSPRLEIKLHGDAGGFSPPVGAHAWAAEPDVGRMAYGVPDRAHRIAALGNAVVPQIPEAIGRAIMLANPAPVGRLDGDG